MRVILGIFLTLLGMALMHFAGPWDFWGVPKRQLQTHEKGLFLAGSLVMFAGVFLVVW